MDNERFAHIARVIKLHKRQADYEEVDHMFFRIRLEWAGHLARLATYRPNSLTSRVLRWRDRAHLERIMEQNKGSQLHGRRFRVWRWEQILVNICGSKWKEVAQDRLQWDHIVATQSNFLAKPKPPITHFF